MIKYCSVGSGSCGNCHFVGYKDTNILIDAGLSGKRITDGIKDIGENPDNLKGIFITHEHIDHIRGAGIVSRKFNIPIFANVETWRAMRDKLGKIESENMVVFENDKNYSIGDIIIRPFSIEHDAANPVGYNLCAKGGSEKMSIATDIGTITENVRKNLYKSKLVVLESNYDKNMLMAGSYSYALKRRVMSEVGHLSNDEAGKFCVDLIKNGTERILLAHLSKENNFPELAYETSKGILTQNNFIVGQDIKLDVLLRNDISDVYKVNP